MLLVTRLDANVKQFCFAICAIKTIVGAAIAGPNNLKNNTLSEFAGETAHQIEKYAIQV